MMILRNVYERASLVKELAILYLVSKGPIYGRKRLQKLLFLAKVKYGASLPFLFTKYLYGPYSSEIQDILDKLTINGLIREAIMVENGRSIYVYKLTEKGRKLLQFLLNYPPIKTEPRIQKIIEGIDEVCNKEGKKKTEEIVREAYRYIEKDE